MKPRKNTGRRRRQRGSARATRGAPRKPTAVRLDPGLRRSLAQIAEARGVPLNRLVNEVVREYLEARAATVGVKLVEAYRHADPEFESAISKFADAEAELAAQDPVEGHSARAQGSAQRLVRRLIRG